MFTVFREELLVTILMGTFFVLSILGRLLLGMLYRHMIRETDNMATTDNKLLKQCKLKFTNCYQMNKGMPNISIFVDCGSLLFWNDLSFVRTDDAFIGCMFRNRGMQVYPRREPDG